MIPHTCITNGVFSFTLGQEGWGFHYVSRTEEEKVLDRSRRISEGKQILFKTKNHFPMSARANANDRVSLPSPLMTDTVQSGD
jgi:hypothetical protein